jgi:hypothetical protein
MKKIFLALIFITCNSFNSPKQIESAVHKLLFLDKGNDPTLYQEFFKYGKEAIPYLINSIDVNSKTYEGYFHPQNSNLKSLVNYNGVHAAYMIEFILSRDKLNTTNVNEKDAYVLFNRNIIIKQKDDGALEYKDMSIIKSIYSLWWERNKITSINQLRKDWKSNQRPLLGSSYRWY